MSREMTDAYAAAFNAAAASLPSDGFVSEGLRALCIAYAVFLGLRFIAGSSR